MIEKPVRSRRFLLVLAKYGVVASSRRLYTLSVIPSFNLRPLVQNRFGRDAAEDVVGDAGASRYHRTRGNGGPL